MKRIKELYEDYVNALKRLNEALGEDFSKGSIIVDGTIQRFEFTFELAWKLMRAVLMQVGMEVEGPRPAIKEAFKAGIIQDGELWIAILEDRNKTFHIYDEAQALNIYQRIKAKYAPAFKQFQASVDDWLKKNTTD
jgi:nucleotidyltransferase substrate binding protein (TIGR01987 family)